MNEKGTKEGIAEKVLINGAAVSATDRALEHLSANVNAMIGHTTALASKVGKYAGESETEIPATLVLDLADPTLESLRKILNKIELLNESLEHLVKEWQELIG